MSKDGGDSSAILSANLKRLMEKDELSDRTVATKARVDHKTIGNMREQRHSSSLEQLDRVAKVFALAGWQMLRPTPDVANAPAAVDVDKLLELFYRAPPRHRQTIIDVASATPADGNPTSATDGMVTKEPRPARR
jgi:transcriptional regulator with XRE-family HTH domain